MLAPMRRLLEDYLVSLEIRASSPHTLRCYRRRLLDFVAFVESRVGREVSPCEVTRGDVLAYRASLSYSAGCQAQAAVVGMLSYGERMKLVAENPTRHLPRRRKPQRLPPNWLGPREMRKLLRFAMASLPPRDACLVFLLATAGLRES